MRLADRTVLVTGAQAGIGRATAVRCAAEGARVCCADVRPCDETLAEIAATEGAPAAQAVELDVTSAESWDAAVGQVGRVDCLANVAGIYVARRPDTVVELDRHDWERVLAVDLTGVWYGMRAAIPGMRARGGGRIVNVASMAALRGMANMAAYTAAKGGVVALTRQAAVDYGDDGVLINCICPGAMDTPALRLMPDELRERYEGYQVLRRLGDLGAVTGMVVHCFSTDGSFMTGAVVPVDGGMGAKA